VPLLCSFHLRLFTRERLPPSQTSTTSSLTQHVLDQPHQHHDETPGHGGEADRGQFGRMSTAKPACSRVLRVEPLTHVIMTSPCWRTLLLTWNDHMQNWIKTGKTRRLV